VPVLKDEGSLSTGERPRPEMNSARNPHGSGAEIRDTVTLGNILKIYYSEPHKYLLVTNITKFRGTAPSGCIYLFRWDWGLNSELALCKAGPVPLETHLQSILL
jgi:hypothetical protein